jgi:F-type H+-transporting ATPase subunit gamma
MANTRALVKRRKAVRNIRKITKTMELIATARFKKAMDRAAAAEAYTRKITELAADLSRSAGDVQLTLLESRPNVRKVLLLVITSNRGLCGGYNAGILREAMRRAREVRGSGQELHVEVAGRRGIAFVRFQGYQMQGSYTQFEDKPTFEEVEAVADKFIDLFVSGAVDRVDVAYQKFLNAARQSPVVETLLPLGAVGMETRESGNPAAAPAGGTVDYEFLPSAADILNDLVPVAFKQRLFKCFLDAAVSEQIARRVAMKQATESAGDLIKTISRQYNRLRQVNITKEISEVIGGAAALE